MCTRAMWKTDAGQVLVGRNMDWLEPMDTDLWALPAGTSRDGLVDGALQWTSKYGSVVASSYDMTASDGINEAGLGAHMLWLAESDYGSAGDPGANLAISLWAQYFLDNFATVAEAVEAITRTPIGVVTMPDPSSNRDVTVHMVLDDASGDSAVIEYIDGQQTIHHDPSYAIATNSPPYGEQIEHLKQFKGLGGDAPLPGTTEAADRFVRAAYYVKRLPQPRSTAEAVAEILSVLRNAAQPFGTVDPARPNISATIWRTTSVLDERVYFFESSFAPNIVWVDLKKLDLSAGGKVQKIDLVNHGDELVGDVTSKFETAEPFAFLAPQ